MIKLENLFCGYGKKTVLKGLNLEVRTGGFAALIGPNGSGKTTLVRTMSGLLAPQKGKVIFDGKDVNKMPHKELAKKIAVMTQAQTVTAPFCVEEFVLLGRIPYWGRFQVVEDKKDIELVERVLSRTGISHLRQRPLKELSGGERQLANLARALAQEPDLLLLDEPTAHLDIGHQVQIMDLVRDLNDKGLTIVAVLHDLNLASLYCQKLILLSDGKIQKVGSANDVLRQELINKVYGTSITIRQDPVTSLPFVFPVH
jgi:iron complex transport system ATP-binding protein